MAYQKILVDNPTCSRRFHITFDDEEEATQKVEIKCSICQATIYASDSHPPAKLAREENLTMTTDLSDRLVTACDYRDVLSERTQKK